MKLAILGAGAMGSVFGGLLHRAGHDVTLIDVWPGLVERLNTAGLQLENREGRLETLPVRATDRPADCGTVDLLLVFVKCYHTESAVRSALAVVGPDTVVLSLQNGWGNGPVISAMVGEEKLILGVCYHSATVVAPGQVRHVGTGMTYIGELHGSRSERIERVAEAFRAAGIEATLTAEVQREIWSKLALNVCTLPTSALLRYHAPQLAQHEPALDVMRALLNEAVQVAQRQNIALEFDERWDAIVGLLRRCAPTAKASMLQDVESTRRTEIDVINGAIVEAGARLGVPTPYNQTMVWLVKALEANYPS